MTVFNVDDHVYKPKGYPFPGIVRAVFLNGAGETRLVCESRVAPGMLHIFSPGQIELQNFSCYEDCAFLPCLGVNCPNSAASGVV